MGLRYQLLSYPLTEKTPMYGGTESLRIMPQKSIKKGDSCNTSVITLLNHSGTHIDAPKHFWDSGKSLSELSLSALHFKSPVIAVCLKEQGEIIEVNDLKNAIKRSRFDILILKTGFQRYRISNRSLYCFKNPCLSPDAAAWLRKTYPSLRAIATDCISIASWAHRELGRETHRVLLREYNGKSILVIEDMFLPTNAGKMKEILVSPWRIHGIDSAPCNVIGIYND
ncbi:MAG: cyclase family protein [Elusimicrobia bacterium]|nr:cyclase family protein [Elusimicrobiota bacterium]